MTLAIYEYGTQTQPTILFLHGLGVSSWMWQAQIDVLQEHYHCLAVDLPGSGESYEETWHSFSDTATSLARLIKERTSNQQAHVVGLSLGGYLALQLVSKHPEVVLTTLVSGVSTSPMPNLWLYKSLLPLICRTHRVSFLVNQSIKVMGIPDEAIPLFQRDCERLTPKTAKKIYREVFEFSLPTGLEQLHSPLLAVAGDQEVDQVKDGLKEFERFPTAVTRIIPNAGHTWSAEHPKLFADLVAAWVVQQPLPVK